MIGAVSLLAAGLLLALAAILLERKARQSAAARKLAIRGGIVEERYVPIGGIAQWISIRGEDKNNPALLILHGGPGCSYSIFTPHLRAWEKHFTIVQWDQRGSARTFSRNGKTGPVGFEQLTADAIEVAGHACTHLGKDRLFLMASSVGSTFGLRVAHSRPDLFHAYIGTDQNVGMARDRHERHEALLAALRKQGLAKGVKAVQGIGSDPTRWSAHDFDTIARWTMRADPAGFRRTMKLLKHAVWYAPHWTLIDIRAFASGMRHSLRQLLPEMATFDAWKEGTRFSIPFFIFQGENDVLTPAKEAKAFFDDVIAPVKQFSLIMHAGHFAAFLQPEEFLNQLLFHVRPLSQAAANESDSIAQDAERGPMSALKSL